MPFKKIILRAFLIILLIIIAYALYYASQALPIISSYAAKNACSCVMVAGRDPDDVRKYELSMPLIRLADVSVNFTDSSASASVFGLARQKAIFRKGLGCTLVAGIDEKELRSQKMILPAPPAIHPDTIAWPNGNLIPDSVYQGIDYKKLGETLDEVFSEPSPDSLRRTRAVVVVYDDKVIAERYAKGFTRNSRLTGWSMTKSITNALTGLLVKQGKLDVHAPAPVKAWKNDERKNITLHHLLQASSGLKWEENYAGPSPATRMLFRERDAGRFAAASPLAHTPGEVFYYSSGTTNIISRILRETLGDEQYYRFPYEQLFYKTGMLSMVMEPDAGGTFVGSSFCFGTALDWARFGLLYLNDGVWNGERILPEGWVKYTTTPAPGAPRGQYGAQFWLNAGAPGNPDNRIHPDAPTDLFWANGYEGQSVFIIPSQKLVVVKLSLTHGDRTDDNAFLAGIIASLPQEIILQ